MPTGLPIRITSTTLLGCALLVPLASSAALPIQHWTTSAGAHVYFVESHDLPMLDVSVLFPAGCSRDTVEKSGVANLTLQMLRLGADDMNEDEIARRFADVGADLPHSAAA